jgi:hypothetical protein
VRQRETQSERETERERQSERERDRERERDSQRETQSERERERETVKSTNICFSCKKSRGRVAFVIYLFPFTASFAAASL